MAEAASMDSMDRPKPSQARPLSNPPRPLCKPRHTGGLGGSVGRTVGLYPHVTAWCDACTAVPPPAQQEAWLQQQEARWQRVVRPGTTSPQQAQRTLPMEGTMTMAAPATVSTAHG